MSPERLRRVLEPFLIDSLMARGTAVNARNGFERLVVIQIIHNDLVNAFRRSHEVEYGSIPEGRHYQTGIESIHPGLKPGVVGQHRVDVFLDRVPFADVFVQFIISSSQVEIDSFQLGLVVVQLFFGFSQPVAEALRV